MGTISLLPWGEAAENYFTKIIFSFDCDYQEILNVTGSALHGEEPQVRIELRPCQEEEGQGRRPTHHPGSKRRVKGEGVHFG